ncbi:MAG TPA: LacI family DNA-binding transcriptional regulator [Anaerolineales bacterium]|nr:LacI family DNA-binding transcriptional regulator [Anaerolineales bacterium]
MSEDPVEEQTPRAVNNAPYVTLQDVASLAGVSIKTVSRVVNNQGEISEATRQRVQAAIDELGYRPNVLARSLVNRRTDTLAVIAWGIEYFGPSRMMIGIEQQADELGYSLFLSLVSQPDDLNSDRILDTLLARRVDGIIWAVPEVDDNRKWLKPGLLDRLPPIVFLSMQSQPGLTIAAVNNFSGARQATQHLIDQGRRKIGMITGPKAWWEARERFAGWKSTLEEAGLPATSFVESYWAAAGGERAMQQLLKQTPDIDAVFASSDQIALGALGALHQLGRRIPADVAIVGFDNSPESAFYWPPLTTIYQKLVNVGHIAVQNLHQMIEARRQQRGYIEAAVTLIEPELIIRASSA